MEMKDRMLNTSRYSYLGEKCLHCNSKDHIFTNCMMVYADKSSSFAFLKSIQSFEQARNPGYSRKKVEKTTFVYLINDECFWSDNSQEDFT